MYAIFHKDNKKFSGMHLKAVTESIFWYNFSLAYRNTALYKMKSLGKNIHPRAEYRQNAGKRFNVRGSIRFLSAFLRCWLCSIYCF